MPVIIIGTVEDVQTYEGKSGFGSNITMSTLIDKRRKSISFNTRSRELSEKFEKELQKEVTVKIELAQSNFGLRLGDIYEFQPNVTTKDK